MFDAIHSFQLEQNELTFYMFQITFKEKFEKLIKYYSLNWLILRLERHILVKQYVGNDLFFAEIAFLQQHTDEKNWGKINIFDKKN